MKNKYKIIVAIILIVIITSIVLICLNNRNSNIEKQETKKEQLTETTVNNAYISMADHLSEVNTNGGKIAFAMYNQNDVTGIGTYVYDKNSIEIGTSKFVVKKAGTLKIRIGTNCRYNSATNGSYGWNYLYVNGTNVSTAQGISIYYSTQLYTYNAQVGDTIYFKSVTSPGFAFAYYE